MLTKCLCKFNVTPYQPNAIILSYRPIYKGTKLTRATKSEKNSLTQSKDHVVCTCQLCSVKTPTLLINTAASSKLKTPTHQTPPRRKQSSMTISSFVCCFVLTKKKKKKAMIPIISEQPTIHQCSSSFNPKNQCFCVLKKTLFSIHRISVLIPQLTCYYSTNQPKRLFGLVNTLSKRIIEEFKFFSGYY